MTGTSAVRRRGVAVAVAAAVLSMPLGLAPAQAEPDYPPSFYKISAEAFNARVGQSLGFKAQTFEAGSSVAVDVSVGNRSVGSSTAKANAKGIASTSVTFTTAGVTTVTMSGTSDVGDPLSLSADVTVTAKDEAVTPVEGGSGGPGGSSAGGSDAGGVPFLGGGLPRTGTEVVGTVLVGAVLIGLGALLVVFTRRRRTS
jgi:LPXTG-motif cell wall-anchored protein